MAGGEEANIVRPPPRIGDRVRVTGVMRDDPDPIPVGAEGTVDYVGQWHDRLSQQIGVKWDNGRSLMLLGNDPYEVIP
jgi:hypothetical protein